MPCVASCVKRGVAQSKANSKYDGSSFGMPICEYPKSSASTKTMLGNLLIPLLFFDAMVDDEDEDEDDDDAAAVVVAVVAALDELAVF